MIKITVTKLRSSLFKILSQVSRGEIVSIQKNGKEVAMIVPAGEKDWRDRMKCKPELLIPADKAFSPIPDIWNDYK